jgi:hypothetical protein
MGRAAFFLGLLLALTACAPAPIPVLHSGQPVLVVNWPAELRTAAQRQDLQQLDGQPPEQVLQTELVRQLQAQGHFARIESRPSGQALRPFAGAQANLVLDTTLERLALERDGRGGTSIGMGLGTGSIGFGVWKPFPGSDFNDLCAVAEVHALLQDARSGEMLLDESYRDSSCPGPTAGYPLRRAISFRAAEASTTAGRKQAAL